MTFQQLTYFLATVEHGSFSGAARSLFLTQPSISEQIRQLEGELGIALFARAGRGLVLTEAGRKFRPEAERVLADVERARDAVAEVRDLRGGTLGFGMFGTASAYLIADLATDFRKKYPRCAAQARRAQLIGGGRPGTERNARGRAHRPPGR